MQIDRLREEHRHQQVTVQPLNNQVNRKAAPELGSQPKLEQRNADHRDSDHKRADVGNEHREAHQHRQQQRVVETEENKTNPRRHADDDHLQHFAANIVSDLLVHLHPHLACQATVARQNAAHSVEHLLFVLHQEEDHQRHQHQIDRERQQPHQRSDGVFNH